MNDKKRVICYIDGFNLYHAIDNIGVQAYKWLDLRKLALEFVDPTRQELSEVKYFTAYAKWRKDAFQRHKIYVRALRFAKVQTILGRFQKKDIECKNCSIKFQTHEEKETDVNIALSMVEDAFLDRFDTALLISRDSDLKPPIISIKQNFPNKKIVLICPPNIGHSWELKNAVGKNNLAAIKEHHLKRCQLNDIITLENGKKIFRPDKYR